MSVDVEIDDDGNVVEGGAAETTEHEEDNNGTESSSETSGNDAKGSAEEGEADEQVNDESITDDEREAIRARRREERKNRKQHAKEREDTLKRELAARDAVINELRARQDAIEHRNTGSELAQLETAKRNIAQAYNYYKDQIRIASENGDGASVAEATEKMIQAQRKFDEIASTEAAFRQAKTAPQPLDPRLASHAQRWMSENRWYDPNARDQDSLVARTVDQRLAEEGWDPTTEAYWDELSARVKKYLPHRISDGKMNTQAKPKAVVAGSGRDSGSSGKTGTYKLSAERVQAMKDAGIWDNPEKRAEAVKRYREFDKQQTAG